MVVEVKSRMEATEVNQQRVEANILLLGAHNVGKTGEKTFIYASVPVTGESSGTSSIKINILQQLKG